MANKTAKGLTFIFGADLGGFERAMKKAQKSLTKFGKSMKRTGANLSRNVTLPLVALGAASIKAFDTQAKAIAQVEAGLKSTGNQVGITSKQLQKMAADLQKTTLFGDEEILKNATAQLLTFTNISGKQFERTQQVALDLATRLDGDLKSASIMLGKALNDPVANLSALSRAGIQFSKEQKTVVKSLVETNRLADAQTIILDELEKQYGGSAAAAAQAGMGPLQQLSNTLGDLGEQIGGILLPIVIQMGNKIKEWLTAFTNLDKDSQKVIVTIGLLAAAIGPLLFAVGQLSLAMIALFSPTGAIMLGIIAVGAGLLYVADNFEAFKERLSDWTWWKNALITAVQWVNRWNPMNILIKGFNKLLDKLGMDKIQIPNAFEEANKELEKLKDNTKEYETEFGTFADALKNGADKAKKALAALADKMGLGGGGRSSFGVPFFLDPNNIGKGAPMIGPMNKTIEGVKTLSDAFSGEFQSSLAMAMTSQENFFESFISNIKRAVAQMIALQAAQFITNRLFGITTGVQGAKTGANIFTKIFGFANGGLVTGPTLSMVGEGSGTSISNPEVIAPLDKLKQYIGGGSQNITVTGRLVGNDIWLSNSKTNIQRQRAV